MGFLSGLLAEKRSNESFSIKNPPDFLKSIWGGYDTKAGVEVSETTSLSLTAVWSCVIMRARIMASFPRPVYKRLDPRGKERDSSHPLYSVLHDKPNPEMSAFDWSMQMSISYDIWGAGISEIEYDNSGNVKHLWPIPAWRVKPKRIVKTDNLVYEVSGYNGKTKILRPEQVLIFKFFPWGRDGWLSPIGVHRETIGSALAVKEFGARTFGQGVNPAGILTGVTFGDEDTEESLQKKYSAYSGLGQSHRLMLLEEGHTYTKVGLPPEDAQYLETRKADLAEVARIYSMPLFLLQETEKSTSWGSGLEELKSGLIAFTMRPTCVQWEQEINNKLFDSRDWFTEHVMDGLLRGNIKDRFEAYQIGSAMGVYSINDMLELENMNPLTPEIGDTRLVPLNMQTLENAIQGGDNNAQ